MSGDLVFGVDGPGPAGFFFTAITAVILVAAWVILASSRFIQGGIVERPERVPQLYGYTVCLVTLVWALGTGIASVENVQTLMSPAYSRQIEYGMEPSITSFEAFRLTYDRARRFNAPDPGTAKMDTLAEPELRKRYETYRTDRIATTEVQARQSLVKNTVSLLLAVGLFVFHWRWLRRQPTTVAAT